MEAGEDRGEGEAHKTLETKAEMSADYYWGRGFCLIIWDMLGSRQPEILTLSLFPLVQL